MYFSRSLFILASTAGLVAAQAHGETGAQEMGPVAFLWPPDREWSDDMDNTGPCGSATNAVNRTEFPLTDGAVSLVMQDDAWDIDVAIYYGSDEAVSITQFLAIIEVDELEAGHICYYVPDQNTTVSAGSNATFQLMYVAEDDGVNVTHYVCADVTFVPTGDFNTSTIPCFNVTYSSYYDSLENGSSSTDSPSASATTASSMSIATATQTDVSTNADMSSSAAPTATSSSAAAANVVSKLGYVWPAVGAIALLFS
ncbi:hypothetical protein V1517DRAFT_340736 [Lipomyces orientalis]|uniref:Uncharacterized protein n=1 Tax=Lipomyces orientalis TaxID=1233043 RepID=A0ACC3THK8_9ASCO